MTSEPLVSVIIPTFRALDCLRVSLPEFLRERRCEVVIGLDGDNSAYRAYLEKHPVSLSVTRNRQGACSATNLAAAQARGRYLLLCNDDMVPGPGWLDAMLRLAGPNTVVSGTCWEPGLVPAPPPHAVRDFGHDPESFGAEEFFDQTAREKAGAEPGINYPFLVPKQLWDRVGGLDTRFEPGSASDPDLFIRLALLEPRPAMVRARSAIYYHFASRSSIFAAGRLSLAWKLHRRHGRAMFRHKWGRMWEHRFGDVPDVGDWRGTIPRPEPAFSGRLWRKAWFGYPGSHEVIECGPGKASGLGAGGREKIAIFIWGGLGNTVMALPMVNAVRAALGDGNVTLVMPRDGLECLVRGADRLGGVLTHRGRLPEPPRADVSLPSLPYPRWRYGLAAVSAGAKLRIGDAGLSNPLLNRMVDTRANGQHWVERNLALLEGLGIDCSEAKFDIPVGQQARRSAAGFLRDFGLEDSDRLVGLHPGSGNPMRRWPEERFAGLGRLLASQGKDIVVFGGPGENDLAGRVASGIGGKAVSFCGSLEQALALISLCRPFVAADSGLAHCAAALGRPVLAIMGPSDEHSYRPYGPKVRVLTGEAACRPCHRPGKVIRCRFGNRPCLDVGVEEALEALRELW
jgi:heptosyltransferase-2